MRLTQLLLAATLVAPATAQVTTIRVEIDYMESSSHSHRPDQAAIDAVIEMFACKGITLIVDVDDAIPHDFVMGCDAPGVDEFFNCTNQSGSFANLKATYADHGAGWHYGLFVHQYNNGDGFDSSGLAELPGNDFLVADGLLYTHPEFSFFRASTFAHELGHNLGLEHHSPTSTSVSDGAYAPNLPSVMNYCFQLAGIASRMKCLGLVGNDHHFREMDYSSGRLPTLSEPSLREPVGSGMRPMDWDCDGQIDPLSVNRELDADSDWCALGAGNGVLRDFDEWGALTDVALTWGSSASHLPKRVVNCADMQTLLGGPSMCTGNIPLVANEPCPSGLHVFVNPAFTGLATGTGSAPFRYLDSAVQQAPPTSVIFLQAGTTTTFGGLPLVINKALVLDSPGGAVINP